MYNYEIKPYLKRILDKLSKKDKSLYGQVLGKIEEIISSENVGHYKQLKYTLKQFKGVHIGHFVLVFKLDESLNLISFDDFDHHDKIYRR